jgi:hypothetical protein
MRWGPYFSLVRKVRVKWNFTDVDKIQQDICCLPNFTRECYVPLVIFLLYVRKPLGLWAFPLWLVWLVCKSVTDGPCHYIPNKPLFPVLLQMLLSYRFYKRIFLLNIWKPLRFWGPKLELVCLTCKYGNDETSISKPKIDWWCHYIRSKEGTILSNVIMNAVKDGNNNQIFAPISCPMKWL